MMDAVVRCQRFGRGRSVDYQVDLSPGFPSCIPRHIPAASHDPTINLALALHTSGSTGLFCSTPATCDLFPAWLACCPNPYHTSLAIPSSVLSQ